MGGHHKKSLRAEKAKVKLKGAKLPKGLNVTKTDFKVRKIVIKEQLHESQVEDGRRKLNMKETLSRLKHSSSSFRLEALRNLRESIASSEDVFRHLGELIQSIAAICLDVDKDARRESFKVLSSLFAALSLETIEPFFHAISSYLRCAMTHIQPAIQEDSLLLLDVLLQHVPNLVAANSTKIFQNFLDMISKLRSDSKPGRMLTVNMGNKTTTIKWRSKVLERLQGMLKTLIDNRRNRLKVTTADGSSQYKITNMYSLGRAQHFPIIRWEHSANCDLSQIFNKSIEEKSASNSDDATILQGYIEHLMPLLFESWLEVRPSQSDSFSQIILSYDAAHTLKVVLEILQNLWSLVEIHESQVNNSVLSQWFRQTYADSFTINFLSMFPYQQSEGSTLPKGKSKGAPTQKEVTVAGGQQCLQQNVTLAYLMCVFYENKLDKNIGKISEILLFLTKTVGRIDTMNMDNFECLERALRGSLFLSGEALLQFDEENTRVLLRTVIKAAQAGKFSKDGLSKVTILLCDIVLSPKLYRAYGKQEFEVWLSNLPKQVLLKTTISQNVLVALSDLGKQKNEVFLKELPSITESVIENMQKAQIFGAENAFEGKKYIMNLFFWIEKFSEEEQRRLLEKIDLHITDKRIASYFKFIIKREINCFQ